VPGAVKDVARGQEQQVLPAVARQREVGQVNQREEQDEQPGVEEHRRGQLGVGTGASCPGGRSGCRPAPRGGRPGSGSACSPFRLTRLAAWVRPPVWGLPALASRNLGRLRLPQGEVWGAGWVFRRRILSRLEGYTLCLGDVSTSGRGAGAP